MAECMLSLINKKGTIIIEVQYLMNTLKDLTFDNIYHEHYNYWSLTSLVNFFKQFKVKVFKAERINTHGGSIRIFISKNKNTKIEKSIKELLDEEVKFGIKQFKTYESFGKKVYKIRDNVIKNLKKLKIKNKNIVGYGAPAKATTALNFFGISKEIDYIVEDNKLKHRKFVPGVKIPIYSKQKISKKKPLVLVLAWNFYDEIIKNNPEIAKEFVNIKSLEFEKFL
tara:strand:- start:4 stop:678 length:675 start_codon:yes stop_codon:yes gene_type:complete